MRSLFMGLLALVLAIFLFASACTPASVPQYPQNGSPGYTGPPTNNQSNTNSPGGSYPYGPGGMVGGNYGNYGLGGMMGYGYGGMMGSGSIGPGGPYRSQGQRLTLDQATSIALNYLKDRNDSNLALAEIMEYDYNFYVEYYEKIAGIYAFEALIDPYTGDMYPEPGPNMMWNSKYGMMSGVVWGVPANAQQMTVTEDHALQYGQKFIDGYLSGAKVQEPHRFYGYYTLHVVKDGNIYGMLSVNGYTGQVWYHSWHGRYIGMKDFK
jgi:hypothetical protein